MIITAINKRQANHKESGSILVIIIIAIVLVASVGAAILSNTSSSTFTQLGSVDSLNGYFLAEAGKYYALEQIKWEIANDKSPTSSNTRSCAIFNSDNCTSHTAKTFTLPNTAGQFSLALTVTPNGCDNSGTACTYKLTSTGIPNNRTNRVVNFEFSKQ